MREPVQFDRPPVVEVACGVLFASRNLLKSAHVGAFWEQVRSRFPKIEDVPPIESVIEGPTNLLLEWDVLPPLRRTWLVTEDGRNIIQIQQDRFLFNWKRTADDISPYPSYAVIVEDFLKNLSLFEKFLASTGLENPGYRQFELIYVNHITASNGLAEVGTNGLLVDHIRDTSSDRFLPEPEGFNWATSYPLPEASGRLHIAAQSAVNTTSAEKIVRLDLTARGIAKDSQTVGCRPWFDLAHDWVTQGFADVTSKKLHNDTWKRTS